MRILQSPNLGFHPIDLLITSNEDTYIYTADIYIVYYKSPMSIHVKSNNEWKYIRPIYKSPAIYK